MNPYKPLTKINLARYDFTLTKGQSNYHVICPVSPASVLVTDSRGRSILPDIKINKITVDVGFAKPTTTDYRMTVVG